MTLSEWKDDFKGFIKSLSMPRDDYKGIMEYIDEVPEPHWIPVTERLPDNSRNVLITHKGGVSMAWYNGSYFEKGASTHHRKMKTVTAWRELPESYKGGDRMSIYEFDSEFEELMDKALNELSPRDFKTFLDHIDQILADYQDEVTE